MTNQKAPHNRTLSDLAGKSTKVDASSIAPVEDAELRDEVNNIMFNHMGAEGWNGSTSTLVYIASIDDLMQLFDKQASRIRAEALDLVEREVIGENERTNWDDRFDNQVAEECNALRVEQRAAIASLRQEPGERGQG